MTLFPASEPDLVKRLVGRKLPDVELLATDGTQVNLARLAGLSVIYAYPRTSSPSQEPVPGWADIPGAKGCTPQSCGFRDHFTDLQGLGVARVYGLSTQSTEDQQEAAQRLHLPFTLLSDANLALQQQLGLATFEAAGMTLLHRVTLIIRESVIEKVFHPISDPSANAADVITYLTPS